MMKFIQFDEEKCDSCYKCLRTCPTKAISFFEDKRHIIDKLCIKCGLCQSSCPQEALKIRSSVDQVMDMINRGEKVAVSIAPSFVGAFALDEPKVMVGALKYLGFDIIEETAIGAELVANFYDDYISEGSHGNIITSCCPSANYLIEQHYPLVIPSVIPVVSPMIAHGRSIKKRYGEEIKVVFIGPCLAKIAEAEEIEGSIDAVLTFDELDKMIKRTSIKLHDFASLPFNRISKTRGRAFPLGGSLKKNGKTIVDDSYRYIHVDGIEACKEILNEVRLGSISHCCIELNICEGSCINGPDMPNNYLGRFARELYMRKYVDSEFETKATGQTKLQPVDLKRSFEDRQEVYSIPNMDVIKQIMAKMGKRNSDDELNCGACGYKTCHDKAVAVFLNYSDIETCLPYLREKAESMQSVMIENSPNAVVLIDSSFEVKEINPSFGRMFNKDDLPVEEMPITLFIDHPIFNEVIENKKSIHNRKIYVQELDCYYFVNMVYLEDQQMMLGFLTDISSDEQRQREFTKVKEETLLKTQEVIDKQMRVAQEIASLLGETTAETKMSLKSLNALVLQDRGGL